MKFRKKLLRKILIDSSKDGGIEIGTQNEDYIVLKVTFPNQRLISYIVLVLKDIRIRERKVIIL